MRHARQRLAAEPVARRAALPSPPAPSDSHAEADDIDRDIAARLQRLDHDQLMQVAEALGRRLDGADEGTLRQSIAAWVDEWADDVSEDQGEEDPDAARAAGRVEAIALLDEELNGLLDEPLAPDNGNDPEA